MELVIKDIKKTTQRKYMDYGKNPGSPDNDFLFMYSVARWAPSVIVIETADSSLNRLQIQNVKTYHLKSVKVQWKYDFRILRVFVGGFVEKWAEKHVKCKYLKGELFWTHKC